MRVETSAGVVGTEFIEETPAPGWTPGAFDLPASASEMCSEAFSEAVAGGWTRSAVEAVAVFARGLMAVVGLSFKPLLMGAGFPVFVEVFELLFAIAMAPTAISTKRSPPLLLLPPAPPE